MKKRTLIGLLAALPLSLLTACGSGNSGNDASVRLVNASPGYAALDLYDEDTKRVSGVAFGTVSSNADFGTGTVTTSLTSEGSTTELLTQDWSFSSGDSYTIVAYGWGGALKAAKVDNVDAADSDETSFRVFNTATDAGDLDVYLTGADDSLESSTPVASDVSVSTSYSTVSSGNYRLRVTAAGDTSDVRLDTTTANLNLPSKGVIMLILTPTPGGVLVNGMSLKQGGALTQLYNTQARARVVANVAAGGTVTATAGSTTLATNAKSPSFKDYVLINAGTVNFNSSVNGQSLAMQSRTVAAGEDLTLLVTGNDAASATVTIISDDNRLPTTGTSKYKVRMIHGSNQLSSQPVTLTINASDVVVEQAFASASAYKTRDSATEPDVTVTVPATGATLMSLTDQTMVAKGLYTIFVYDTVTGEPAAKLKKER